MTTALLNALGRTRVDVGALTARSGGHEVTATSLRELRARLANAVYSDLHAGRDTPAADPVRARTLRDPEFENRLAAVVPHRTAPVDAVVVEPEGDRFVVVRLPEARVRVARSAVRGDVPAAGATVTVDLPAVRAALSPGFLLVNGAAGAVDGRRPVRRVYVHLPDARHAPTVWATVLDVLARTGARYRAKVLSDPTAYPRRDAVVVYHSASDGHLPTALASALSTVDGVAAAVSVFARRLGPGIAAAWEPHDARVGMRRTSFGQHRAMAVAEALIRSAVDGRPLGPTLEAALREANIDPADPSRNLTDDAP